NWQGAITSDCRARHPTPIRARVLEGYAAASVGGLSLGNNVIPRDRAQAAFACFGLLQSAAVHDAPSCYPSQPLREGWMRRREFIAAIGLAAAVGLVYFLAARLSIGLVLKPAGVAVFWPAAGISSGVLIALGFRRAGWPVAIGVTVATVAVHELVADPLW